MPTFGPLLLAPACAAVHAQAAHARHATDLTARALVEPAPRANHTRRRRTQHAYASTHIHMRRANAPLPTRTSSPEVAILCVCWLHTAMRAHDATQLRASPRHVLRPTLLRAHSATRGRGRALAVKRATDRWPHRQENRRRHDQALARFQKYGGRLFISFFLFFCPYFPATI